MARTARFDRDETLDAAMSLFWDKGYHATSLKDLEATLDMKPGSIYAAFKSKENLYLLALEKYSQKFRQMFRDKTQAGASPLGALADHLRSYTQLSPTDAARQACMLTKTLVDTRSTDPAIADMSQKYMNAMRGEIRDVFLAAIAKGELAKTADANRLARRYQANITALRMELHQNTAQSEVINLVEDMIGELEMLRI